MLPLLLVAVLATDLVGSDGAAISYDPGLHDLVPAYIDVPVPRLVSFSGGDVGYLWDFGNPQRIGSQDARDVVTAVFAVPDSGSAGVFFGSGLSGHTNTNASRLLVRNFDNRLAMTTPEFSFSYYVDLDAAGVPSRYHSVLEDAYGVAVFDYFTASIVAVRNNTTTERVGLVSPTFVVGARAVGSSGAAPVYYFAGAEEDPPAPAIPAGLYTQQFGSGQYLGDPLGYAGNLVASGSAWRWTDEPAAELFLQPSILQGGTVNGGGGDLDTSAIEAWLEEILSVIDPFNPAFEGGSGPSIYDVLVSMQADLALVAGDTASIRTNSAAIAGQLGAVLALLSVDATPEFTFDDREEADVDTAPLDDVLDSMYGDASDGLQQGFTRPFQGVSATGLDANLQNPNPLPETMTLALSVGEGHSVSYGLTIMDEWRTLFIFMRILLYASAVMSCMALIWEELRRYG